MSWTMQNIQFVGRVQIENVEHQVDWLCADKFECCGTSSLPVVCKLNDAGNHVCCLCVDLMLYSIVVRAQIECCGPSSSLVLCRLNVVKSVHLFSNLNYYFLDTLNQKTIFWIAISG